MEIVHTKCITYFAYKMGTGGKRPQREAVLLPPSSTEIKNTWIYTSTLLIRLYGVVFN
jgi:hypothetical protein